ncbi:MAG: ABC transporter substrate-binding protein [Propionibacteriaceae bacterium]|nr:ABC transporter substrate-binding protein [Propionibacteriaceae bacterium]
MKTKWIAGIVAAIAAASLAGCSTGTPAPTPPSGATDTTSTAPAELQTVNVGIMNLAMFAPLYIADANGYFADEGIKLNLQVVASGQDAVPLASSGKLDVVVAGFSAGMFNAISQGLDIKVVGSMAVSTGDPNNTGTHLVAAPPITSVDQLKGKKIGAAGGAGGTGAYITALALEQAGLTLNDVEIVNLANPDMPTALKNGGIDAALLGAPFSFTAMNDGGNSIATPPKGYSGTGVIYGGQFAKTPYAQKFFNALAKGSQDLQNGAVNSDANLAIIAAATKQDVATLKAAPFDTWLPNLAPLPDQLNKMQEVWMASGAITYTTPLSTDVLVDATYSQNVPS